MLDKVRRNNEFIEFKPNLALVLAEYDYVQKNLFDIVLPITRVHVCS